VPCCLACCDSKKPDAVNGDFNTEIFQVKSKLS
jgi:hypothetical protein